MKKLLPALLFGFCSLLAASRSVGQGIGSIAIEDANQLPSSGSYSTFAETIIIPPGTYNVNFTWQLYGKYIWIASNAVFTGSGKMQIMNPGDYPGGGTPGTTYMDGNLAIIGVDLELQNPLNLELVDMEASSVGQDPANELAGNAGLYITGNFIFGVDYGDLILGSAYTDPGSQNIAVGNTATTITDLVLSDSSAILNYQPNRMVVTSNSIQGHVVKNFCSAAGSFIFPVGIAEQDYTPALVSVSTLENTIHVSVQNYAASASADAGPSGMDRTWNIFGDGCTANTQRPGQDVNMPEGLLANGGTADITLQHNITSDQPSFNENSYFITQWSAGAPNTSGDLATSTTAWQSNTSGAGTTGSLSTTGTISGSSVRSRTYTDIANTATDPLAYFSKSSNAVQVLPLQLLSFTGKADGCNAVLNWATAAEKDIDEFIVEYSADGKQFAAIETIPAKNTANNSYSTVFAQKEHIGYYRLAIIEKNGGSTYSSMAVVRTKCDKTAINIWPNPATEITTLSGLEPGMQVRIYNCTGQLVYNAQAMSASVQINTAAFAAGIYQVYISDAAGKITGKKLQKN